MANYPNFFENHEEAHRRLYNTVVTYDGEPYYVNFIAPHSDGIFRVYLSKICNEAVSTAGPDWGTVAGVSAAAAIKYLDEFMAKSKYPMIRKMMNSPKFNRFRPFPLGMLNTHNDSETGGVFYLERTPERRTTQGLSTNSIIVHRVNLGRGSRKQVLMPVRMFSDDFRDCIMASHPSFQEVVENLRDPEVVNEGAAFARDFAVVRGPLDLLFLCHKTKTVGLIEGDKTFRLRLDKTCKHLTEAAQELGVFYSVQ